MRLLPIFALLFAALVSATVQYQRGLTKEAFQRLVNVAPLRNEVVAVLKYVDYSRTHSHGIGLGAVKDALTNGHLTGAAKREFNTKIELHLTAEDPVQAEEHLKAALEILGGPKV